MSRMKRAFQAQAGARDADRGFIGDALKLPYVQILQDIQKLRLSETYRRFVTVSACALTLGQQEALYLDTVRGLDRRDLDVLVAAFGQLVEDMEARPYLDLLGPAYMAIAHQLDRQSGGEFFTPHALSVLMAQMNFSADVFTPGQILECNEPACGTGGMILAAAQVLRDQGVTPLHTRWTAQDISARSCYGTFINTTLWGIPARVICGNTISQETRWTWTNVHWTSAKPWPTDEERRDRINAALRAETMLTFLRTLGAA